MDLKGSQTEKNLQAAYAGESQAAMKYGYYAKQAKKDGYSIIEQIFTETQGNEAAHAKLWFKYLHGGEIPSTEKNLADAAAGENYEWTDMSRASPRPPRPRASTRSPLSSPPWAPSRRPTRSATTSCSSA